MKSVGIDVLVADGHSDALQIRDALARALALPHDRVAVIRDIEQYPALGGADVVCTMTYVEGEFGLLLSVDGQVGEFESLLVFADRLSELLSVRCLTGTDSPNPYEMWLVQHGKPSRRVFLVADAADRGRYEIDGSAG